LSDFQKIDVTIIPIVVTSTLILYPGISNTSILDEVTFDVGGVLMLLWLGNDVSVINQGKTWNFC